MATLAYDDFPVSSTILRERKNGALYITVPASDPDARAMKAAKMHTAIGAAGIASLFVLLLLIPFMTFARDLLRILPWSADVLLVIVVAGAFVLFWQDMSRERRDALQVAWRRAAIIVIDESEILIEMDGRELSLARRNIRKVEVNRERFWSRDLSRLTIEMDSGSVELLEGRDFAELEWVRLRITEPGSPPAQGGEATRDQPE